MKKIIVGISGASAPLLGIRFLEVLSKMEDIETHLVCGGGVVRTLAEEAPEWSVEKLAHLATHAYELSDMTAAIASGSFITDAMVVIPCSMKTLGAIAGSLSNNLLIRAADVTLKERRPLILVPRETPLHLGHLRNMVALSEMGAVMVPPMLATYHQPTCIEDMIDYCVGKVLDVLKIKHDLFKRWNS